MRRVAEQALAEQAADRQLAPANRRGPDYWVGRLSSALQALVDATAPAERWWIATDELAKGGAKLIGPFESRELAIDVRTYVERANKPHTYAVDQEVAK